MEAYMFAFNKAARTFAAASIAMVMCTAAPAAAQENDESSEFDTAINVTVRNRHFNDVRVYAVSGTRSWRLGNVVGMNTDTFEVPRFLSGFNTPIKIVAYPIGTATVVSSHEVVAQPGDEIVYTVESHLPLSNVRVVPAY
jgi:hypothetical protein